MNPGLRQRMSWLHTWCGLVCAWLLCLIFVAGTISVFRAPITRWMTAEPPLPAVADVQMPAAVLAAAGAYLSQHGGDARFWRIELPDEPDRALRLVWRSGTGTTHEAALDPRTGDVLPPPWGRKTEGGRHFMTLHYTLHGGTAGFWLVGWLTVGLLVALLSGIVVHKRIFKDFFTFRPGRGLRAWLDGHNASAVLTLPFQLMIAYTGLAVFYTSYMPWPLEAAYGDGGRQRWQAELADAPATRAPLPAAPLLDVTRPARLQTGALLAAAETALGSPGRMIMVTQPGQASERITVYAHPDAQAAIRQLGAQSGRAVFHGSTGAFTALHPADGPGPADATHHVMERLHVAAYGGWTIKWLYFVSGLLGTLMVATGAVLFTVKRRNKSAQEFGAGTPLFYRLTEALNVAAIAGACVACIAYFHANRLIAADLPARDSWEIRAFFIVWLLTLWHAWLRPMQRAWVEQFACAAALCLTLPLVNALTTGQHSFAYARAGNWEATAVEWTIVALGGVLALLTARLRNGAWVPPKTGRVIETPARYRWQVLGRVGCALVGGYALAVLAALVLTQAMALTGLTSLAIGVVSASLLSFLFYALAAMWVFAAPRAWAGLLYATGALAILVPLLEGA